MSTIINTKGEREMGIFSKKKTNEEVKEEKVTKKATTKKEKTEEKKVEEKKEEKKTTKKPIYRVVYDKEARTWVIKKDGAKRTIASYATKEEALARVLDLSQSNDLNFIVHKKDGKFQKKANLKK